MAKLKQDTGFRAGFSCSSARSFAKGIPMLRDNYELDSMRVREITGSGFFINIEEDKILTKEIMPDKSFLFSSKKGQFILNCEFKTEKHYGNLIQAGFQYCSLFFNHCNPLIEKRAKKKTAKNKSGTEKRYYTLLKKSDNIPTIYSFIINTSRYTWKNNDWEDPEMFKHVTCHSAPGQRYIGTVDVKLLNEEQIMRFGEDLRCVFRFAQASGNDEKIKAVFRDHQDEIKSMDMSTSLMALALIGPDHYHAAISSSKINCKEESKGMLKLYFNDATYQYYVDQVNQARIRGEARGIAIGEAKWITIGESRGIIKCSMYDGKGIFSTMKYLEALMPCSLEKAAHYFSQFIIYNRNKANSNSLKH